MLWDKWSLVSFSCILHHLPWWLDIASSEFPLLLANFLLECRGWVSPGSPGRCWATAVLAVMEAGEVLLRGFLRLFLDRPCWCLLKCFLLWQINSPVWKGPSLAFQSDVYCRTRLPEAAKECFRVFCWRVGACKGEPGDWQLISLTQFGWPKLRIWLPRRKIGGWSIGCAPEG